MAQEYIVKPGDTLNKIAQSMGYKDYQQAGISGYGSDPDKIAPGMKLSVAGGPKTTEVPGIGTMTITPKAIPTATPGTPPIDENLRGAYERAGLPVPQTPPPPGTANGYVAPAVAGIPQYPSGVDTASAVKGIMDSYNTTKSAIETLERQIASASVSSAEEKELQRQLAQKKADLDAFDLGTLEGSEALMGQGRGRTIANVALQDTKLKRVRALERLGLANEAEMLTTQLGLAQADRKERGDLATTQYNLATKKLDIALGIQDKILRLQDDERDNARQFLLDSVNFAAGKTYDELDGDTQAAIVNAVSNSPITLDMVKTALSTGAERARAQAAGELRTVDGLGVVQIDPATGKWKVIVPEQDSDFTPPSNNTSAPSFTDYVAKQGFPIGIVSKEKLDALRVEYDQKYNTNVSVNLGKLTPTDKNNISQAGLGGAPSAVQSYYLNTPAEFQDAYKRDIATGKAKGSASLEGMISAYTTWYNANKKSGTRDWSALLKPAQ